MKNVDRFRFSVVVLLVLAAIMLAAPVAAPAQVSVGVSVSIGPPPLPVYEQPLCPVPGYIWVPGFWAWDPGFGYYWVPGMWSPAPFIGALWTPGYWGWNDGVYIWYAGYWGPVVGYYGGVNYGYGYTGRGYYGGRWQGNAFYYNRTVNNINVRNVTTYYSTTIRNVRPTGASFNGPGGATVRPTPEQLSVARERRAELTGEQERHMRVAREDPKQRAIVNHGRPAIAATVRPGEFNGRGVTGASRAGAGYREPSGHTAAPREHVGTPTPRPGHEMHQGAMPERGVPGTQRMEPERQPRPEQQRQQKKPQQPREEEGRGERGRME
jgi:hypothetical protein